MSSNTFLYPNVTSIQNQAGVEREVKKKDGKPGEFDQIFDSVLGASSDQKDLSQMKVPLKFSVHASQRLRDRKIALDPATLAKLNDAVDKAEAKGIEDTLVLTSNAALIVNVKNRTVVTALDRNSALGNVFTNIDGAVII